VRARQKIVSLARLSYVAWQTEHVIWRRKQHEAEEATPQCLDDAEVARNMTDLASAFVRGAADERHHFDFAPENAPRLDALVEMFRDSQPSDEVVHSMVMSMGAYVGEVIVRSGAGSWTYEPKTRTPGVQLHNGLVCYPLNKVSKRITIGPEHSIAQFVEVAISRELPPAARRVDPPSPQL
jgi:hypothetical protein